MSSRCLKSCFAAAIVVALLLLSTACVNPSSYHTARTVEPGETEITVALAGMASTDDAVEGVRIHHPSLHLRRGLASQVDLGLSAGSLGTGVDVNFMAVDTDAFSLAVNPTASVAGMREMFMGDSFREHFLLSMSYLGILADIHATDDLTLTLGAKPGVVNTLFWGGGSGGSSTDRERETALMFAGSLGAKIDLDGRHLFPEVNVVWIDDFDEGAPSDDGLTIIVGVGFGF